MSVKYSSGPLGEGKGGSRYIIFRELYNPCDGAMNWGQQGPRTWIWQGRSGAQGKENGKRPSSRRIGGVEVRMPGSHHSPVAV